MRRLAGTLGAAVLALAACGGGGPSDAARQHDFCTRLELLTQNDPFQAFGDRATSAEIEAAFHALVQRASALAEAAPDDVRPTARSYAGAATALDTLMAAAGYDGGAVDARAYRDAQNDYTEAAASLERYLTSQCGVDDTAPPPPG